MWTRIKYWSGWQAIFACLYLAFMGGLMFWVVYELTTKPAFRRSFGLGMLNRLKWYLIWALASYVVSWIWKKLYPKEKDDDRAQVQESQPEGKRRRNKRPQRGR